MGNYIGTKIIDSEYTLWQVISVMSREYNNAVFRGKFYWLTCKNSYGTVARFPLTMVQNYANQGLWYFEGNENSYEYDVIASSLPRDKQHKLRIQEVFLAA